MDAAALRAGVRGSVIDTGERAQLHAASTASVWNSLKPERHPAIVAAPEDDASVVECVRFARTNRLRIAVRGGGHHWSGTVLQSGSLQLDLSRLAEVTIDPGTRSAAARPGVRGRALCRMLSTHGLAFPYGHCSTVPLSGYLLAGGFGWNAGEWGPACLSLRAADVVTAAGELVRVDAEHHTDLFWALRGAGAGFFAVATRYHLALQPLPRAIAGSTLVFPLASLPVVAAWAGALSTTLSNRVELTILAAAAPPDLGVAAPGMACVIDAYAFANSPDEATALLAAVEAGPPGVGCLARRAARPVTYDDLFAAMDRRFPERHRYLSDTFLTDAPAADVMAAVADLFQDPPSPRAMLLCIQPPPPPPGPPPPVALSIAGRVFVIPYAVWSDPADDAINRAWHRAVVERLEPFANCHYIGEADLSRPDRVQRSFSPETWQRLLALRDRYDPDRLFHTMLP